MSALPSKAFDGEPVIRRWARDTNNRRSFSIEWPGVAVMIRDQEDEALLDELVAMPIRLRASLAEAAKFRALVEKEPDTILGEGGCIRLDGAGHVWLLNKIKSGFASWGIQFDCWDHLFRAYDLIVDPPQSDVHGLYWPVRPQKGGSK